uniref:Uncharacterized protein n=1 Tax=Picea sitchensis TaxID=3332 RepID=A0A6B9XP28_PICSI|nr:hypothetical protein Q903MT_gene3712 [Picea sitchensis]
MEVRLRLPSITVVHIYCYALIMSISRCLHYFGEYFPYVISFAKAHSFEISHTVKSPSFPYSSSLTFRRDMELRTTRMNTLMVRFKFMRNKV